MIEKVAVATVQGKTYFLIVKKLKEQNVPFISLVPGESACQNIDGYNNRTGNAPGKPPKNPCFTRRR